MLFMAQKFVARKQTVKHCGKLRQAFTEQNQSYNRTHSVPVTVTQRVARGTLIRAIFGRKRVDLHVLKREIWSPDFVLLYGLCFRIYKAL
jgi:hypothetical protein